MPTWVHLTAIFLFALILEISWVLAVRLVNLGRTGLLVLTAMGMQTISYLSTIILVDDHRTMAGGIIGSGLGALIAMRFPESWFGRSDPTG